VNAIAQEQPPKKVYASGFHAGRQERPAVLNELLAAAAEHSGIMRERGRPMEINLPKQVFESADITITQLILRKRESRDLQR
jgi:hypothetical protein